jgi:hypothetical protein
MAQEEILLGEEFNLSTFFRNFVKIEPLFSSFFETSVKLNPFLHLFLKLWLNSRSAQNRLAAIRLPYAGPTTGLKSAKGQH